MKAEEGDNNMTVEEYRAAVHEDITAGGTRIQKRSFSFTQQGY